MRIPEAASLSEHSLRNHVLSRPAAPVSILSENSSLLQTVPPLVQREVPSSMQDPPYPHITLPQHQSTLLSPDTIHRPPHGSNYRDREPSIRFADQSSPQHMEDLGNGTLSIDNSGRSKWLGPSAASEWIKDVGTREETDSATGSLLKI